jgi:hypothetical protein
MPNDVLKKCIEANDFRNGAGVVSVGPIAVVSNHKISPVVNITYPILAQSGSLDNRLDEVRYYSGDTSA